MGSDYYFKPISPKFLSQSNADGMGFICGGFSGLERLDAMIAGSSAQFAPVTLCLHELFHSMITGAVDISDIGKIFRLQFICGVLDDIIDFME